MRAGKSISDLINLLLYDKGFTPDTVADDDILVYDDGTGLWTLQTITKDVTELTLYDKVFDSDTPADRDFVVYEEDTDSWHLERNLLSPISGIAFLTEGYDLDVDGDILMSTGAEVDGIDISAEVMTIAGNPFGTPVSNSMLYWGSGPHGTEWKTGHSVLLGGANTTLHYHDADRARADHTGTQAASTISDFEDAVGDMFDSSDNEHDMVTVEYTTDEKVNISPDVPFFLGYVASNIATNGTTYVDLVLSSDLGEQFTHTNGNANVEIDVTGIYMLALTVNSNFNINNELMHTRIEWDIGSGYVELPRSYRATHTSTALGTLVAYTIGPYYFAAGYEIKLVSKFGAADAGSNFLADKCTLSIWRIA